MSKVCVIHPDAVLEKGNCSRCVRVSSSTILKGCSLIDSINERLQVAEMIADIAKRLFKTVLEQRICNGEPHMLVASACLYTACRQEDVSMSFKEIASVAEVRYSEVGRVFKKIQKKNKLEVGVISSEDFLNRWCGKLSLPRHIQKAAAHIARKTMDMNLLSSNSPTTIAATSIYIASQASEEKRSFSEISRVTMVGGQECESLKQIGKRMLPHLNQLFPDNFKFDTSIENVDMTLREAFRVKIKEEGTSRSI